MITATFHPAVPTVGDPIAIDFPAPVALDPSPGYDIVSQHGAHVIVRTFDAKPFALSGRMGNVAFRNLVVPVRSVLKQNDQAPAPLKPPLGEPMPPVVWIAGALLLLAIALIVFWIVKRRKPKQAEVVPALPPAVRFRQTVMALRDDARAPMKWARLADALRDYLAETSDVGRELTTTEALERLRSYEVAGLRGAAPPGEPRNPATPQPFIATILHQGDAEKFSPWGPQPLDFRAIAGEALALVPEPVEEQAA